MGVKAIATFVKNACSFHVQMCLGLSNVVKRCSSIQTVQMGPYIVTLDLHFMFFL